MKDFIRKAILEHGRTVWRVHEFQRGYVYQVSYVDSETEALNEPEDADKVYRILEELVAEGVVHRYNRNNHASMTVWERV